MQNGLQKEEIIRLDHIAYRVANRHKTVEFFKESFGYTEQTEFEIEFSDGSTAKCFALEPPEKAKNALWAHLEYPNGHTNHLTERVEYHLAPEIFVSDGTPDSIVGRWVAARNGVGGIHHMAYQVDDVQAKMKEWREKGYAEFTTEEPLTCPGLTQCFTKPSELTGVIYEFISRGTHGFCKDNVRDLMLSTADVK